MYSLLKNNFRGGVKYGPVRFFKENLIFITRGIQFLFFNHFKNFSVLFYPEFPSRKTIIYKILNQLHYNKTNNLNHKYQLALSWEDTTYKAVGQPKIGVGRGKQINFECCDISKTYVDKIFSEVFKYSTVLNPLSHKGKCVKKSNLNARHDGQIIDCPIAEIESGYIYQKVINNEVKGKLVEDIRIPVLRDKFPFAYIKHRPVDYRFQNQNTSCYLCHLDEWISPEELSKIKLFCKKMSLDYGELDVLRDKDTGQLYIIDVNVTPWGPPNQLSAGESRRSIDILSQVFKSTFLD